MRECAVLRIDTGVSMDGKVGSVRRPRKEGQGQGHAIGRGDATGGGEGRGGGELESILNRSSSSRSLSSTSSSDPPGEFVIFSAANSALVFEPFCAHLLHSSGAEMK